MSLLRTKGCDVLFEFEFDIPWEDDKDIMSHYVFFIKHFLMKMMKRSCELQ